MKWHGEENEKWEIELTACDKEIELTLDYSEIGINIIISCLSQL